MSMDSCLPSNKESDKEPTNIDVLVIGAGWSGLLAAKHCQEQGLSIHILEMSDHVGGVWKYQPDVPGGVMKSTQTTSSWSFTEISDFPLEGLNTDFPRHELVQDYLERFAAHHDLVSKTSFCCGAKRIIKDADGMFNIYATDGRLFISKRLCVSTGFQGNPRSKGFETLTAGFTGEIRHANTYKHVTSEHFDKNILVIGGGETASDLCNEVSYVANRVYLSIPNGQWFGGRFNQHWEYSTAWPLDNFSSRFRRTLINGNPEPEKFEAMKRWAERFDGVSGHGFECWKSPFESYGQAIINKSNDVLRRCVMGTVVPKGKMTKMEGRSVFFEDGTRVDDIDLIYFATGYRMEFPFLEDIGKRITCVSTLYKLCLDCQDESIAFVGFARPIRGSFPSVSESAARYVAHAWSGKCPIPPPHERERVRRLDKLDRDMFFTAIDQWGFTKKCPDSGGIARANMRAAGLTELFLYSDTMAKLCDRMPNYLKIFRECGFRKWLMSVMAPHHQGQYNLNDPKKREYVFDRYNYFLQRFPVVMPVVFSALFGTWLYLVVWLRNRVCWTFGYLFFKRPHSSAKHVFELRAEIAREKKVLSKENALLGSWPPSCGTVPASCSSSASSCSSSSSCGTTATSACGTPKDGK